MTSASFNILLICATTFQFSRFSSVILRVQQLVLHTALPHKMSLFLLLTGSLQYNFSYSNHITLHSGLYENTPLYGDQYVSESRDCGM